jgi:hypothetical protein
MTHHNQIKELTTSFLRIDQGALLRPFLLRHGTSALVRQLASWKCLKMFLRGALPGALELYFLGSPELGLRVCSTPSQEGLVSSMVGLGGPVNGRPRRLQSSLCPSGD